MSAIRRRLFTAAAAAVPSAPSAAVRRSSATAHERAAGSEATAATATTAAAAAATVAGDGGGGELREQERVEHARFVGLCRRSGIDGCGVAPAAACSSTRFVRVTAEDPGGVVGLRGGRGLVATQAHEDGDTVLCAPVGAMLSVESLHRDMARDGPGSAGALSAQAIPDYSAVATVLEESMIRQPYIVAQMHLTLHVAYARMDPASPFAAYFDTLPVPAVSDEAVLELHDTVLSAIQVREYRAHQRDFGIMLQRLRKLWVARAGGEATPAGLRVPTVAVLHWAWRTVLGRQAPLPLHEAPLTSRRKGVEALKAMHFVHWYRLRGREAELRPMLTPYLDLVDHGPVANAQLEVSMLPLGTTCAALNDAVRKFRLHDGQARAARSRGEGLDLTALADRLPAWLRGMTQLPQGGGPSGQDEAAGRELFLPSSEQERLDMVPHVQLQLLHKVSEGEPIVYRFTEDDSKAFGLYRFGFIPLTH